MTITKEAIKSTILAIKTVADCIKEAKQIPSGHLYALLMAHGIDMQTYNKIIGLLTSSKLVKQENNLLIWIG